VWWRNSKDTLFHCHPEAAQTLAKPGAPNEGLLHAGAPTTRRKCIGPSFAKCRSLRMTVKGIRNPRIKKLIYPARFIAAILLVVIRRDVIAIFVEGDFAVVLAHVDFEFPGSPPALPAVIIIPNSQVSF